MSDMFNQKDSSDAAFEFLNDKGFFAKKEKLFFQMLQFLPKTPSPKDVWGKRLLLAL